MKPRHVLWALLAVSCLQGAVAAYFVSQGIFSPQLSEFVLELLPIGLIYLWYYLDACERRYARNQTLGGAIILIGVLTIPYYLVRSRPRGEKAKALWRYLGLVLALSMLYGFSAILVMALMSH